MARFGNLHNAGQLLADVIADETGVSDVRVGPVMDPPVGQSEAVRVTLLWVTPQPTHRNDPYEPDAGGLTPPPVTVSAFFLVTTYGSSLESDPIQAHNLLGQVLQIFHTTPVLELPPASPLGEGRLSVVQVPTAADLMEKIYSVLQQSHRPWVLYEAGPVQLVSLAEGQGEQPVVHPGGLRLAPLEVMARPAVERATPAAARVGQRLRLDASYAGSPARVTVGGVRVEAADLSVPESEGPIFLDVPAGLTPGAYELTLTTGQVTSEPITVRVEEAPGLDAPLPASHSVADDLTLTGHELDGTVEVVAWPDGGVTSPEDVHTLAITDPPAAGQVEIAAATLGAAGLRAALYRFSARSGGHAFTPYVLLEVTP